MNFQNLDEPTSEESDSFEYSAIRLEPTDDNDALDRENYVYKALEDDDDNGFSREWEV